ncbi:MAG: DUF1993 domain-containing protein [Methylotenera sp.]|uniref:DUF1993 domain-containing protein n=1 Tax=Methylotenera sp. TaxID=2051956 RepID=UPI00248A45C2|nr:DUF1993 domain-containing protein [Methylotenera sp.]MDI1308833.1 DUF1993 domain-containing protein [Methylotenera sp.]
MLNMYEIAIPPLDRALSNLTSILKIGEEHADAKKIEHAIFLNARLFPDMYPLIRQVQIATDMSKGAAARLARLEVPKFEDNESTFADLYTRIAKTIAFLDTVDSAQLEGSESREVIVNVRKIDLKFSGQDYLLKWVNPNVYFHITTCYNILRHNGVELGKPDFLGSIN